MPSIALAGIIFYLTFHLPMSVQPACIASEIKIHVDVHARKEEQRGVATAANDWWQRISNVFFFGFFFCIFSGKLTLHPAHLCCTLQTDK